MSSGIASFNPKTAGVYIVNVTQDGNKYPGSPFKLNVGEADVAHAHKVKLGENGLKSPIANEWNKVSIDISEAGEYPN